MRSSSVRRRALIAAGIALTLTAAACSDPTAGQGPGAEGRAGEKSLNVYLYQKPTTFNPVAPAAGANGLVMQTIFEPLLAVDEKYELVPKLAESYELSKDGTTYTFHLRKGVKWSDGKPFTSKDVLFTYLRFADPKSGSAYSANFESVEGIEAFQAGKAKTVSGFQTPNADTFVLKSKRPNVGLAAMVGVYQILPEHVLGKIPVAEFGKAPFFAKPTVGTGPYRFVTYKTDQYVEVEANEHYRTKVGVDRIFMKPVTSDVATAGLGTKEMDLVQISPTDLKTVEGMKDVEVVSGPGPGFIRIAFDLRQKRFADPRVRQALAYAVDRKAIVDKVLAGKGTVQSSIFLGDAVPKDLNTYPYDPAKARKLLKAAGWDSSKPVVLQWIPGQRDRDSAATIVESQLNAVGVKLKLQQVQTPASPVKDGLLFGGGNYATDPYNDRVIISCRTWSPKGGNLPRYCNEKLDALMEKANGTLDEAERMRLYQQAARIENREASYLWLYNPDAIWAHSSRLKGFTASGDFTNGFFNAADWSIG